MRKPTKKPQVVYAMILGRMMRCEVIENAKKEKPVIKTNVVPHPRDAQETAH
jgi:hypothetical protein